ncbi:MAG: NADPH:quinone oxidoreductase family protein [Actinobacteria bacterium]|nr:MAG: NADPH:quinone oxidoreductase family protein [Actinomycetota bacterium]
MRALQLTELSGPDGLRLAQVADAEAGDAAVLIEVHAAGVGFVDLLLCRGEYQIKPNLPFVPGIEVAGVVRATPPDSELREGQRVAATTPFGAFAELAATPEYLAFGLPEEMTFDQAAGFVVNYQTAHLGLLRRGRLAAGETVLVHGAAGGVGSAAVQVAKAAGARVIGVVAGERKAAVAAEAGADEVLDVSADWAAGVRELTEGRGADVVFDPVGGERFEASMRCTAPEGRLLVVGFAEGRIPQVPANRLLLRHLDVVGVNFGGMLPIDQQFARRAGAELLGWAREGRLAPIVGSTYPLAEGAQALRELAERRAVGKPVIRVRETG